MRNLVSGFNNLSIEQISMVSKLDWQGLETMSQEKLSYKTEDNYSGVNKRRLKKGMKYQKHCCEKKKLTSQVYILSIFSPYLYENISIFLLINYSFLHVLSALQEWTHGVPGMTNSIPIPHGGRDFLTPRIVNGQSIPSLKVVSYMSAGGIQTWYTNQRNWVTI